LGHCLLIAGTHVLVTETRKKNVDARDNPGSAQETGMTAEDDSGRRNVCRFCRLTVLGGNVFVNSDEPSKRPRD